MNEFTLTIRSLDDTERLGSALADLLPDGTTVALCGTLGAGKTRLVQSIAAHCNVPRGDVVSPTFVLCQEYHGNRSIYHFDAYRLRGDDEFQALGPDECFRSPALVFIEWADRVPNSLPTDRLEIRIDVQGDDVRHVTLSIHGARLAPVLEALRERLRG